MEAVDMSVVEQIAAARARVSELLLEIDDITLQINPQIEALYATKIGYLENDLLKWQIAARRARRRFTLAQARVNAGKTFEPDEFEAQLDEELQQWDEELAVRVQVFLSAAELLSGSRPLSPSESRELKQLHRELIKRLHPDLHPGQSDEAERFFLVAQAAFERGDLQVLRAVSVATEDLACEHDGSELTQDEASVELELVLAHERIVKQQLEELKSTYPYVLKDRLEDGEWVIARTSELKRQIAEQKEAARAYDERFEQLVGGE